MRVSTNSATIGERLAELRKERNFTQTELAKKLRRHRVSIAQWETDERKIPTEDIALLADELGTSCDYLLRGYEPEYVAVGTELGLSQRSINSLKTARHMLSSLSQKKDPFGHLWNSATINMVNLLLEEQRIAKKPRILDVLYRYFTLSSDVNEDAMYMLSDLTNKKNDVAVMKGSDFYSACLIDVQLAIVRLKERIDSAQGIK